MSEPRTCPKCKRDLTTSDFYPRASALSGLRTYCKRCDVPADPRKVMLKSASVRARRLGVPFTITLDDIQIPDVCPLLGTPVFFAARLQGGMFHSPSLDRIIPALGYVPGNVWVISKRANSIKNDASPAELHRIADVVSAQIVARGLA